MQPRPLRPKFPERAWSAALALPRASGDDEKVKNAGVFLLLAAVPTCAATLRPETNQAFDRYIRAAEARMEKQRRTGPFLWADESPQRLKEVRSGTVVVQPWTGKGDIDAPGGLIHDWIGAVFIPGATLSRTLAWAQNYDAHEEVYPEVLESKTLSRNGNAYRMYMRYFKKKVISAVLDTEHEVRYFQLDPTRWYSQSYTTKISEVKDAGEPTEQRLPPGEGHGFMWRLNSYWRFEERDGGVYVECEAISLSRGIPAGLGWLIGPIVRELPKQSLEGTLEFTRKAVLEGRGKGTQAAAGNISGARSTAPAPAGTPAL